MLGGLPGSRAQSPATASRVSEATDEAAANATAEAGGGLLRRHRLYSHVREALCSECLLRLLQVPTDAMINMDLNKFVKRGMSDYTEPGIYVLCAGYMWLCMWAF